MKTKTVQSFIMLIFSIGIATFVIKNHEDFFNESKVFGNVIGIMLLGFTMIQSIIHLVIRVGENSKKTSSHTELASLSFFTAVFCFVLSFLAMALSAYI